MDEGWLEVDEIKDIRVINNRKIKPTDAKIALRVEPQLMNKVRAVSIGSVSHAFCLLADYAISEIKRIGVCILIRRDNQGFLTYELSERPEKSSNIISVKCERKEGAERLLRTTLWSYPGFVENMKKHTTSYYTIAMMGLVMFSLDRLEEKNKSLINVEVEKNG